MSKEKPLLLDKQIELEKKYNKNQLWNRIRLEIKNDLDLMMMIQQSGVPEKFGIDLIAYMTQYKRVDPATLIGLMRFHYENLQDTADMCYLAAQKDLVDYDPDTERFICKYDVSGDVQREIDIYQFPLPMVVQPLPIRSNKDTGYVCSTGSVILANNFHWEDVSLDHLNRMNKIAFSFEMRVVNSCENKWKNLDQKKPDESFSQFKQRRNAFEYFDSRSREVIQELNEITDKFYFTHAYDKRGRVYCRGYHVSYQGNDWCKGVLVLANKEICNG